MTDKPARALTDFVWTAPCLTCGDLAGLLRNPIVGPSCAHVDTTPRPHLADPDEDQAVAQEATR